MKIEYIQGDLFTTDCLAIVHGCNAQGIMGSGVAKIVKRDFNAAFLRYRESYNFYNARDCNMPLGHISAARFDNVYVVNVVTQNLYGRDTSIRYANYEAIALAMANVEQFCKNNNIKSFAMPMIGSGLGNGDWNVIEAIIESEIKIVKPYVYYL